MIFRYAFEPQAIVGGGFGYAIKLAISQGAKRGLFSNEAGMGSTPHATRSLTSKIRTSRAPSPSSACSSTCSSS